MRLPGLKTAKQTARWLYGRIRGGALILGYHRVDRAWMDSVFDVRDSKALFGAIGRIAGSLPPNIFVGFDQADSERRVPRRTVVLTFDDGYADLNQTQALLAHYRMPATVFVPPAYLGREFWWDELARVLLSPAALPEKLGIEIGDILYQWAIDDPIKVVWNRMPPSPRQRLLRDLYRRFLPLSVKERQKPIEQLRVWAGQGGVAEPQCRALNRDELIQLASARGVDIGLHSMTHPVLARLPGAAQQKEIEQGKTHLQELLGQPVTTFSYPNGSFTEETMALVKNAGFACACASQNGLVWHKNQLFRLPRLWAPDWDGATFSRWLQWWLSN